MTSTEINYERILVESQKARRVFELYSSDLSENHFGSFPEGTCGNVSDFLAHWLQSLGIEPLNYIWGHRNGITHGWLEFDDYIIDITADQFSNTMPPVYVSKNREFHNSIEEQKSSVPTHPSNLTSALNKFITLMNKA